MRGSHHARTNGRLLVSACEPRGDRSGRARDMRAGVRRPVPESIAFQRTKIQVALFKSVFLQILL
jgi:hypothetical protein